MLDRHSTVPFDKLPSRIGMDPHSRSARKAVSLLTALDALCQQHFGAGVEQLEALIEASQARAFSGPKVKEAAAPFSGFAIPPDEKQRRHERAEREAAERKAKQAQAAKWAAEEAAFEAEREAAQKAQAEAERIAREAAEKKLADMFPADQRAALETIIRDVVQGART